MRCEFEEKQYEQQLNVQLSLRPEIHYSPGQVLEHDLGFDAALYTEDRCFWDLFNHGILPSGARLDQSWWQDLEFFLDYFPPFRFNVFIQHKRPEYLSHSSSSEWVDWDTPYFRFKLTSHQQEALERLEHLIFDSAIVTYAAPAFWQLSSLWESVEARNLVSRSNFCQPGRLRGHHRYTYIEPGSSGKAHSDPKEIDSLDLKAQISRLSKRETEGESNMEFIIKLGRSVNEAIAGIEVAHETFQSILEKYKTKRPDRGALQNAFMQISAFNFVVGTRWYIGS